MSVKKDCPRCFYADRKLKITRPEGIKSGMPNAVDNILKKSLAQYQGDLPPVLKAEPRLQGFQLYTGSDLKKMRHWASNPYSMMDAKGNKIAGAFDDLLHNPTTDEYAYLDYKTTGKEPGPDFGERFYQSQCDIYTKFLIEGGKKVADFGVLLFFFPAPDDGGNVTFKSKAVFLTPNPQNADKAFEDCIALLDQDTIPAATPTCEYCSYTEKMKNL
jgi:hypothetical protein